MGNILVVDDEASLRITLKAFLEADGHRVATAEMAEAALSILQTEPVDVVLTDIILPKVSGVELLRRIREKAPSVQVIMMTGEPTLETAAEALRLGAMDYLQKPITKHEILKAVRNGLHVKQLSDTRQRLEKENQHHLTHLEQLVEKRTQALVNSETALRRRAEELSILNRLSRKVNESVTVDDAVQCGLREIVSATAPDMALFFLRTDGELVLKGRFPDAPDIEWQPQAAHTIGKCLCGLAIKEGKAVFSSDIHVDDRCTMDECRLAGFRSFAALPLRSGGDDIGVLGIASLRQRDFRENASFLEALANEMAIGLKKNLLYEQVQRHARELKESLSRIEKAENERVALQQHLQRSQKMEAIGTLASGIAHDFNNILGAVIGYAELAMLGTHEGSRPKKNLQMVLTACERAKDLVRQILAFSRPSEEERRPVQLELIAREVLKLMRASFPSTIDIEMDLDAEMPNVLADPVQIHQVLMNLCTNALHAMKADDGGVLTVRLKCVELRADSVVPHPDLRPGPYVHVSVQDTGHGMDEATLAKIFDPYFTTKEKGVGTGLGLSVVHGIVQTHGGAVTVESTPGKGSSFSLYFPSIQREMIEEKHVVKEMPGGIGHILLVDDEQALVDMGQQMLSFLGYSVETRTSSVEALELFRAQPMRFDLVITDLTIPNMTGDKLALELMQIRPDIPIILCTGYSETIMEERARAIGIRSLIRKPILMAELAQGICAVLQKPAAPPV